MYLFLICILFVALIQGVRRKPSNVFALTKGRCDILKAVLPILIIIHHHSQRSSYPAGLHEDFLLAGAAAVWVFFAISGYGLTYSRSHHSLRNKSLIRRLWGLYLPTIIPICFFILSLALFKGNAIGDIVKCLRGGYFPLPFSWFIQALAMLYAAFYLADRLCTSRRAFLVAISALTAIVMVGCRAMGAPDYFYSSDIGFLVGVYYCEYETTILRFLADKSKYVFALVLMVNAALCMWLLMRLNIVLKGVWILSILAVLPFAELNMTKATRFLSSISYEIYLCQGTAFLIIMPLELPAALSLPLIVALSMALAYISKNITSRCISPHRGARAKLLAL